MPNPIPQLLAGVHTCLATLGRSTKAKGSSKKARSANIDRMSLRRRLWNAMHTACPPLNDCQGVAPRARSHPSRRPPPTHRCPSPRCRL
eukprot:scaffold178571_cov28-Tisochrysis_lutea.AAC.2